MNILNQGYKQPEKDALLFLDKSPEGELAAVARQPRLAR